MILPRRLGIGMIVGVAVLGASPQVRAFGVLPPSGLRGIKAVTVTVISIPASLAPDAEPSIAAAVTERLAASNVAVLSEADWAARDDCAYLQIRVRTLTSKSGTLVACVVEASVPQAVKLVRDPSIDPHLVATYQDEELGLAPSDRAVAATSAAAAELARRFCVVRKQENR